MSNFNRGLDDEFVDALNAEYDKRGWWHRFVHDMGVFVAIRNNSVNAYYRGCSLLKLDWRGGAIEGEVHYKYLLRPSISRPYVKIFNGVAALPDNPGDWFLRDVDALGELKKAAQPYAGKEKTGVHDILIANHNVLDAEIALGGEESNPSSPRIDFAAFQERNDEMRLVFFEAKHFDNDDLRAYRDAEPKVVKQIANYSRRLTQDDEQVVSAYRRVCSNLLSLKGMSQRHPSRHGMLKRFAEGSLSLAVNSEPVLIVFGFDADQRDGSHWEDHRKKLEEILPGRLLLKGASEKFVRGISV